MAEPYSYIAPVDRNLHRIDIDIDSISTPGLVREMADDVCSITTHLCMAVVHLPSLLHTETLQLSAGEVCVLNYITYTASGAYNRYWRKGSKR